jgi:galactonate dehydratase
MMIEEKVRSPERVVYTKSMYVKTFDFHGIHVNPKTNWTFIRVGLSDGSIGWGECSLNGWEALQASYAERLRAEIVGKTLRKLEDIRTLCATFLHSPGGVIVHSVKSATEQALIDAFARSNEQTIADFLALTRNAQVNRREVAVYANINRATTTRTPLGFGASARNAVAAGFKSVKLAPFDGVLPENCETEDGKRLIRDGIARVVAVREAVGANVGVKVDCHWRFTPRAAREVLDALAEVKLDWFECPVSEGVQFHDDVRALRKQANAMNVKLAGAEMFTNVEGFRPIIEGGLYDTIMPDVKYCGGYNELLDIAALAAKHGVQTAPHNPTGPICNYASIHACALGDGCNLLEYQLGESKLFQQMMFNAHPEMRNGAFVLPEEPGLGATADLFTMSEHPMLAVAEGLHPSLG